MTNDKHFAYFKSSNPHTLVVARRVNGVMTTRDNVATLEWDDEAGQWVADDGQSFADVQAVVAAADDGVFEDQAVKQT
jgi:hypothetical protein